MGIVRKDAVKDDITKFSSSSMNNATPILNDDEIEETINTNLNNISEAIDNSNDNGSGGGSYTGVNVGVNVVQYAPLTGSSYIPLSKFISRKKAVINVKNDDQKCFSYAVLSAIYPNKKHPERVSHYKDKLNELNMDGIEYPVSINNITKFEKQMKNME